jgi:hypothetical protein
LGWLSVADVSGRDGPDLTARRLNALFPLVIPAKAGIHLAVCAALWEREDHCPLPAWIPASAGMTGLLRVLGWLSVADASRRDGPGLTAWRLNALFPFVIPA